MPTMRIGDRLVGDGQPTYIIAEIGVNHNGLLPLALKLIDIAAEAGADAVKFQKRKLENLYPKKYLENVNIGEKSVRYMIPILQQMELSDSDYEHIVEHCRQRGITFLCTPWDPESADFLETLGVPAFKVASADLTNLPLLEHLARKGKPLILSTGMSTLSEVRITVEFLRDLGAEFALLHCNSTYPCPFEDINLRFMDRLREFGVPVGYSGHERGIAISTVAAALGASIIERHLTLDRTMDGPDHAASLEPQGLEKMIRDIRQMEMALGTGEEKFLSRGEILNREVLAKSLVAARPIEPGERITEAMVAVKGPGLGLSPQKRAQLIGRVARRRIEVDEPFVEGDLRGPSELGMEQSFPLQWGFTVRFRDFTHLLKYQPKVLEFHFTDHDLDEEFVGGTYSQRLVIHAPEFWDRTLVDLCALDEAQRQGSLALIQRAIHKARDMASHFRGRPQIIVHPGAMSMDHPILDHARLLDNLKRSVEALDAEGVELLLENLPPRPWYFGGQWLTNAFMDAEEIRAFCDDMGVKICFDISHAKLYCNHVHCSLDAQVEILRSYMRHLHLADAAGIDGEGLQIGEGTIDFVRFFRQLGEYPHTLVPEIWRGHQNGGEGFLIAIRALAKAYAIAQGGDQ